MLQCTASQHDAAIASLPIIDANLSEAQMLIGQVKLAIESDIESYMVLADNDLQSVVQAIENAIDEHIVDAVEETYNAYGKVDTAVTQAVIDAWIAAQQLIPDLPEINLEALEQMGFKTQLEKKRAREQVGTTPLTLPVRPELPPIEDPSVTPGSVGTRLWQSNPPSLSTCGDNPYVRQVQPQEPTIPRNQSEPILIQTPNVIVQCPQPAQPQQPIQQQPGGIARLGEPILTEPPQGLGQGRLGGALLPPGEYPTTEPPLLPPQYLPQEPTLFPPQPSEPPGIKQGLEPQPGGAIVPQDERPVSLVRLRTNLAFDFTESKVCPSIDRLARVKQAAIVLGKEIITFDDTNYTKDVSWKLLKSFADNYWGNVNDVRDMYFELVEKYMLDGGMGWFTTTWRKALLTALGDSADDMYYLSATRAFLQSAALSFASLGNDYNLNARLSTTGKVTGGGSIGLSIPFMSKEKTTGLGAGVETTTGAEKNEIRDGNFKLGFQFAPWIAPLISIVDQLIEGSARVQTLTIEQAISAHLRGGLSYDCVKKIVEINGGDMEEWDRVIWLNSERLNTTEILAAWRRGVLTEKDRDSLLREIGWLSSTQANVAVKLTDYIPGPSDLIRFMVRDVADEAIVREFNLDAEFDAKWKGKLKSDGFAQGISDNTARDYWRSHWDLPGMRSVYDALHRFRDDGTFDGEKELITSSDEVSKILAYNDMLPVWRKRLVALSYNPLTRVDAQRMYMLGVIDERRLYQSFRDIGYDDGNAKGLVEFTKQRRDGFLVNLKPSKLYRSGFLSKDQLKKRLARYKVSDEEYSSLVERLDDESRADINRACITALKKRYLLGAYSDKQAKEFLIETGYSPEHSGRLVEGWDCEKKHRGKEIAAAQLCKLATEGLINPIEYQTRLVRLGYTASDAKLLATYCYRDDERKKIKAKQRDNEAQIKALEKLDKQGESEKEREKRDKDKAEKREERNAILDAARKQKLRDAAGMLAGMLAIDIVSAIEEINRWVDKFAEELDTTTQAAEKMVVASIKHYWPKESGDLNKYMQAAIKQYQVIETNGSSSK